MIQSVPMHSLLITPKLAAVVLLLVVPAVVFAPPHVLIACRADAPGNVDPCQLPIAEQIAVAHSGCHCAALPLSFSVWQVILTLIAVLPLIRARFLVTALPPVDPPPRLSL